MRIGIDARFLTTAYSGTRSYTENIINAFTSHPAKHEFVLIAKDKPLEILEKSNVLIVTDNQIRLLDPFCEQVLIPKFLTENNVDIYFSPTGIIPVISDFPTVAVIHDIGFEHFPKHYEPYLLSYLKKWIPACCESADLIATVSEFSKTDIIETYKIPEAKIKVVYPGAPPRIHISDDKKIAIKNKYGITKKYIYTVTSGGENKNLEGIIRAFKMTKDKHHDFEYALVITGFANGAPAKILDQITRLNLQSDLFFTGSVYDQELFELHAAADFFIFLSLFEGFGLPVAEAMSFGVPVIASNRCSLPEVTGDAGILVDPSDITAIANNIYRLSKDTNLQDTLKSKALARMKEFTWTTTAFNLINNFKELVQ